MYSPKHFAVNDVDECLALMRAYPLATLVQMTDAGLQANHIPLLAVCDGDEVVLKGHVARANPMWKLSGAPILAVFQAGSTYMSPNWYASKAIDHKAVPTWNYAAVHASGVLDVHEDEAWLRGLLTDLTAEHEASQTRPWQLSDAPDEYIAAMLRAVVGIEIRVTQLQGKWKVSQNQSAMNRQSIDAALRSQAGRNHEVMADWVSEFSPKD